MVRRHSAQAAEERGPHRPPAHRACLPQSQLVTRLLRGRCELCRRTDDIQVHHVRALADLGQPQPGWARRKTGRIRIPDEAKTGSYDLEGGQIRSLLSLLSYFGKGEMRERSLGVKIPPTNLKPDFDEPAHAFANKLADNLGSSEQPGEGTSSHASTG
jgi:hypothetical protein